jgi:hypothetical protein
MGSNIITKNIHCSVDDCALYFQYIFVIMYVSNCRVSRLFQYLKNSTKINISPAKVSMNGSDRKMENFVK